MEHPKIVNKIVYDGDRGLAVTYKKLAVRLLESCRLHASFNKLQNYALRRQMDDGTIIEAQVVGGVPTARVVSPFRQEGAVKKDKAAPLFVVAVGNEEIGYKVGLISNAPELTPKLLKYATMQDVMRNLPPIRQREKYIHRYGVKTDLNAYDLNEPLYELYVAPSDGKIHLFPNPAHPVSGPTCEPDIGQHCPYSPTNPTIVTCHEEISSMTPVLDSLQENDLEHFVDMGFTARAWCYRRQGSHSYWARKHEATYAATAAMNKLSFGTDVVKKRGYEDAESYGGECLTTYGQLMTERWDCTPEWTDEDLGPDEQYGLAALVCLTVESVETPVGRAVLLGSWDETLDSIHGVFNSDPDKFTLGKSEPFTYPLQNDFYDRIIAEKDACRLDPTLNLGLYAYTDPALFFTWGVQYRGRLRCPLTKYVSTLGLPGITKLYQSGDVGTGPTYNNFAMKNISFAVIHDEGVFEVYFKNFLEGDFIYNDDTNVFDCQAVKQVSMGASHFSSREFLENLRRVFEAFRTDDITSELLLSTDPEPVKGTVMAYLFGWQEGGPALDDDLRVFELINGVRANLNKPPYAWSHDLSVAARIQAEDMAKHHFLGHIGSDGSMLGQRLDGTGLCGLAVENLIVGENCAMGQETPAKAVAAWINSPPHYAAMIHDKFTEIGIGVAADESGKMYWCTTFAGDDE